MKHWHSAIRHIERTRYAGTGCRGALSCRDTEGLLETYFSLKYPSIPWSRTAVSFTRAPANTDLFLFLKALIFSAVLPVLAESLTRCRKLQHDVRRVLRSQVQQPVGFRIWNIHPNRRAVLGLAEVVLGDTIYDSQ